jgi:hypothetical protein
LRGEFRQQGAFAPAIVSELVGRLSGDVLGVVGELLQVIPSGFTGLERAVAHVARNLPNLSLAAVVAQTLNRPFCHKPGILCEVVQKVRGQASCFRRATAQFAGRPPSFPFVQSL